MKAPAVLPASYSSISAYETCPKQYYHLRILKDVKQEESKEMAWGNAVHKALENNIKYQRPLPETMSMYQWGLDVVAKRQADTMLYAELDVAVNAAYRSVDFWDSHGYVRGKIDVLAMDEAQTKAMNGDWKGLPLDTPLPTPTGWTTMGKVQVGDTLFDRTGKPCKVFGKSAVKNLGCYEIAFDDKTSVRCDAEHLWALTTGEVVPVTQLKPRQCIDVAAPIRTRWKKLPLDPYVLGLWLADGKHTSSEITKPDAFVWEEIERRGYKLGVYADKGDGACRTQSVLGIRKVLRDLGVAGNKHVPQMYLRASIKQRLELLQGIMDGDGTVNKARGTAVMDTTREVTARGVAELLHSLGQRPNFSTFSKTGFGVTSTVYRLSFTPMGISPFLMPRKVSALTESRRKRPLSWRRCITKVTLVPSVPTQCVAVDSSDHTFLCTRNFIPTHNTGKTKPNSLQLTLSTLLCFHSYPALEKVRTVFFWLPETDPRKRTTQKLFIRRDSDVLQTTDDKGKQAMLTFEEAWEPFVNTIDQMKWSLQHDTWPAKPSGLCKAWCPVLSCPHNGKRK